MQYSSEALNKINNFLDTLLIPSIVKDDFILNKNVPFEKILKLKEHREEMEEKEKKLTSEKEKYLKEIENLQMKIDINKLQVDKEKKEYQLIIERNLKTISDLMEEKEKLLFEKTELLQNFESQAKIMKEKQTVEMKIFKENLENLEKVKRKNWMVEKAEEIKAQTIKGLEPEISRILKQHQNEKKMIEEENVKILDRIRKQMSKEYEEKEEIWEKEKRILLKTIERSSKN